MVKKGGGVVEIRLCRGPKKKGEMGSRETLQYKATRLDKKSSHQCLQHPPLYHEEEIAIFELPVKGEKKKRKSARKKSAEKKRGRRQLKD